MKKYTPFTTLLLLTLCFIQPSLKASEETFTLTVYFLPAGWENIPKDEREPMTIEVSTSDTIGDVKKEIYNINNSMTIEKQLLGTYEKEYKDANSIKCYPDIKEKKIIFIGEQQSINSVVPIVPDEKNIPAGNDSDSHELDSLSCTEAETQENETKTTFVLPRLPLKRASNISLTSSHEDNQAIPFETSSCVKKITVPELVVESNHYDASKKEINCVQIQNHTSCCPPKASHTVPELSDHPKKTKQPV